MPMLLHQSRYRPLLPMLPHASLSPEANDDSLAVNPELNDLMDNSDDGEQWRGQGALTPPIPPVRMRADAMNPPGMNEPAESPAPMPPPGMTPRPAAGPVQAPPNKSEEAGYDVTT